MGANVNVPYVAVGFDLVFCYSVLLTPHLHIVKLLENRWIIAFFSQLLGNWPSECFIVELVNEFHFEWVNKYVLNFGPQKKKEKMY